MFVSLLVGIAVLIGMILFVRWYTTADPKAALSALKWIGIILFIVIAGFFIFSGRLGWAFMGLPVLLPWLMRARALARAAKAFSRMSQARAGAPSGETSDVETRFFDMTLNHDTGEMFGTVREGKFKGQEVSGLTTAQLIELLSECRREDLDSTRVLEAYLDRNRPDWHDFVDEPTSSHSSGSGSGSGSGSSPNSTMDRAQALQVLGLNEGATRDEIKATHRKLIAGMHPDHGGSDFLAAQINQAKDILLGD